VEQIEGRVMAFMAGIDADPPITLDTRLMEQGLLDSISLVQLIQYLETEFGIAIPDSEIGPAIFASPAAIAAFVARKQGLGIAADQSPL
jgi:acyl carrier protein